MADVEVRAARAADVAGIGAVQARAWTSGYAGVLGPELLSAVTPEGLAEAWRPSVTSPPSKQHAVLVALAGATVVGFAAVSPSPDPDAEEGDGEIVAFVVDPAHVRAGHGSRLLAAATDVLRDGGLTTVRTWVARTDSAQREFLAAAGLMVDGAQRETESPDGRRLVELRMAALLG